MIRFENIPTELRKLNQWVLWKTIQRDRPTKVPFQPSGSPAKSNDPSTWCSFDEAVAAYNAGGYDGIGFEFSEDDPFCGIDLDGCRDPATGAVADWAKQIIIAVDTYAEVSPSETGVKLFAIGGLENGGRKKELAGESKIGDKNPAIEVYDRGRYFAVTGWKLTGPTEPQDRSVALGVLVSKHWPRHVEQVNFYSLDAVVERARRYLAKVPPAISGSGGHNATFHAACILVLGFSLEREQALGVLREWNELCQPPWSERELIHKVDDAFKQTGERGYLRNAQPDRWEQVKVPKYETPPELETPKSITLIDAAKKYIESIRSGSGKLIDLGLSDLDYALGGGVERGEMVILAGRPSHGKSLVALQVVHNWTYRKMPTLVISEEMSALAIGKRALQFLTNVPQEHWSHQLVELEEDLERYERFREKCFIVESARTTERVGELVRQHVEEHGVEGVVIDYAQLLSSAGHSRYEQITNTSVALRALANKYRIVLLALCQLNRAVEGRNQFIPQASDLKDSGQLEQDADVITCCVWPHRINSTEDPHKYQFFVLKNRNRAINQTLVECRLSPSRQTIEDSRPEVRDWQPEPGGYDAYA